MLHQQTSERNWSANEKEETYLEQEHRNGKNYFGYLCQKVDADRTKVEFPIHLRHINQYRLQKEDKRWARLKKMKKKFSKESSQIAIS